ncbi:long-chain-fatty-acid CoA ligase, putative [Talaromyces stipitatus ATCC 10500]|uniref:Long-chain-fatty-acid CoA ligase, putative n=1 Tax=Talaromyces stipitatus (strain ATCC 10500 / CBS 375.48 / QM 6759 / NRRL 1006) TaxID=441959 RepID=B8LZN9_TALSN|nr:long-chain-fatty-acid CoA ligase, putative [Talaromyces stipitatus ATCC 10500]EED22462.1 long-chain-fatty-acid CoA ligase, putative [Talaromyces stipitatus ATCC 10500]
MSPYSRPRAFLKSIRSVTCGAAPLDKGLQARLQEMLQEGAPFNQVWKTTETSCLATMFPYPEKDDTCSVGRLLPNLETKPIDDNRNENSSYGVRGEICLKGMTIFPGYFGNPKANAESFDKDGCFKTGDYIIDQKKELINVRGFWVAPRELEAVLLSHPQIVDAAVIGVPLPRGDGELRMFEEVHIYDSPHHSWEYRDVDGTTYQTLTDMKAFKERLGYEMTFMERRRLLDILFQSIQDKSRVLFSKKVSKVSTAESFATITAADGSQVRCDFVAGADGNRTTDASMAYRMHFLN